MEDNFYENLREKFPDVDFQLCYSLIDVERLKQSLLVDGKKLKMSWNPEIKDFEKKNLTYELFFDRLVREIKKLLDKFKIVHVHANNFHSKLTNGLPKMLEVTFLYSKLIKENIGYVAAKGVGKEYGPHAHGGLGLTSTEVLNKLANLGSEHRTSYTKFLYIL